MFPSRCDSGPTFLVSPPHGSGPRQHGTTPPISARNTSPTPPRQRCAGCGWALTSYIAQLARFGTQPEDILAGHLALLDSCTDAYRDLGRVEYLYLAPPLANPPTNAQSKSPIKSESGLILAVAGTVRIVTKYAHSKNSYRISFVDARYGGERSLDAVFAERKKAEAALKKARADGEVELRKSGGRDWRVVKP